MCRWDSWALLALPPLSTSPFRAMLCMAQGGTRTTSTKSRWVPQSSGSDSAEALTSGFKSRLVPYACRARTIRTAKGLNWAHQQGPLYRFTKNQRFCDCSCFPAKVSGLVCVFNGHAELEFDQILIASCSLFRGTNNCSLFFSSSAHPVIDTWKQYSGKYCCEDILLHIASRAAQTKAQQYIGSHFFCVKLNT